MYNNIGILLRGGKNLNYLSHEEMIKIITDYIQDPRRSQGILIDGEWGSGKTYFIREILIPEIEKKELSGKFSTEIVYVSLTGLSNKEEILSEIHNQILAKMLKAKKKQKNNYRDNRILGLKLLPYSKEKTKDTLLDYFKIDLSLLSCDDLNPVSRMTLIFDDLERYAGKIQEVLGFISTLIEQHGLKILLVTNEKEIGKLYPDRTLPEKYQVALNPHLHGETENHMTETTLSLEQMQKKTIQLFGEEFAYHNIKEKVVSVTLRYESRIEDLYDNLVDVFTDSQNGEGAEDNSVAEVLKGRRGAVLEIFKKLNHANIRTLIFVILSYKKIYKAVGKAPFPLDTEEKSVENAVKKAEYQTLLRYVVEVAIRIKTGQELCDWEEISSLHGQVYFSSGQHPSDSTQGYHFVDVFLSTCYLDQEEAIQTFCERLLVVFEDNKIQLRHLSFAQLEHWYFLEELEIMKLLNKLAVELRNNEYSITSFRQIIHMTLTLEHYNICINQTEALKKVVVKALREKLEITQGNSDETNLTSYYLFDNAEMLAAYRALVNPIINEAKQNSRTYLKKLEDIIDGGELHWGIEFEKICIEKSSEFASFRGFLCELDLTSLKNTLENSKQEDIFHFKYGLQSVYSATNSMEKFRSDGNALKRVLREVQSLLTTTTTITRKYAYLCLKETLEETLQKIDY